MLDFKQYLNPIYKELDSIINPVGFTPDTPLQEQEYPYLVKTLKQIGHSVEKQLHTISLVTKEIINYQDLINSETGDDKADAVKEYNKLMSRMDRILTGANRYLGIVDTPYFGKIIFRRDSNEHFPASLLTIYLGKFAHIDDETKAPLITDWRAPVANLYYQNAGPTENISFTSPVGEQSGDLQQKRQFEISSGQMHNVYDSKSGNAAADAFLLNQLETRIGQKLKDIVSTIQAQQNSIIREEIDKPVIIQGVAGSGKTTIILHRLAYLFFTYQEKLKPENSLIIAPNAVFLDYISDVLPSLGVDGLQQNTYLHWAHATMKWSGKYMLSPIDADLVVKKLKGSYEYLQLLDDFFTFFEEDLFEQMPDFANYEIQVRYDELKERGGDINMLERLSLAVDYAFAQRQFKKKFAGNYMNKLSDQQKRKKKIMEYINKRTKPYSMYKELFKQKEIFKKSSFNDEEGKRIVLHSNKLLKGSKGIFHYSIEDLAPMVWLYFKVNGVKEHMKDYIVVDEAQDLSQFQIHTIATTAKKGNITLAGDIAQAIVPPFYIDNWEDLAKQLQEHDTINEVSYHQLFRCYRTTAEIIGYANNVFKNHFPKSYKLPEAVLRHGDKVGTIKLSGDLAKEKDSGIVELINKQFVDDSATVAVICRDQHHANAIYQLLSSKKDQLTKTITSYQEKDYHDGILVLPVSHAKGLEFDSVIIADVNEDKYGNDELSTRLLYVAMTRALHRLHIIHSGSPSTLLTN